MDDDLSLVAVLKYEVAASWWAELVGWDWAQNIAGKYFAWKVRRKWNRYRAMLERREQVARIGLELSK